MSAPPLPPPPLAGKKSAAKSPKAPANPPSGIGGGFLNELLQKRKGNDADVKPEQPKPETVTGKANVVSWGQNVYGRLATGDELERASPVLAKSLQTLNFVELVMGAAHVLGRTADGQVYSWGKCHVGQTGHGVEWEDVFYPSVIKNLPPIAKIAAGDSHALFITTGGELYVCGMGFYYCLGTNSETHVLSPVKLDGLPSGVKVIDAHGGEFHTIIVLEDGTAWACGRNDHGQCGKDPTVAGKVIRVPTKIDALGHKIVSGRAAEATTLLLTDQGKVLTLGHNQYGQLGNGRADKADFAWAAVLAETPADCKVIAINTELYHHLALTDKGEVLIWGQLVLDARWLVPTVVKELQGHKIICAASGHSMVAALSEDSRVWTWGHNWKGKLGHESLEAGFQLTPKEVAGVSELVKASGYQRVVSLDAGSNSVTLLVQ